MPVQERGRPSVELKPLEVLSICTGFLLSLCIIQAYQVKRNAENNASKKWLIASFIIASVDFVVFFTLLPHFQSAWKKLNFLSSRNKYLFLTLSGMSVTFGLIILITYFVSTYPSKTVELPTVLPSPSL